MLHEHVAGIDVHKEMIKVAIRSPGEGKWVCKTDILEFRTFYGVLEAMARGLPGALGEQLGYRIAKACPWIGAALYGTR